MSINIKKLLEIKPETSDRRIASMIAEYMLETDRTPYVFAINHNVRPPKCLACPVHYDWAIKDRVGINTTDKEKARRWLIHAAMLGYIVDRYDDQTALTCSIAIARRRAEIHQRPKPKLDDDDIPF